MKRGGSSAAEGGSSAAEGGVSRPAEVARLAVVVPVFDEAAGITSTLEALASQDDPDFDVFFVDNNSTDSSAEVIRAFAAARGLTRWTIVTEKQKVVEFMATDSHGNALDRFSARGAHRRKVLPGVLVGRELAKNLRVFVGDEVNVVSPMGDIGPAGSMPRSRPFRIAGVFYSGMYEYDSKYVYLALPAAQKFLGHPDEATGIELRTLDPDSPDRSADDLRAAMTTQGAGPGPMGGGYQVQTWQELNRNLFSALQMEKLVMAVILGFIVLVASFIIVATLIMLVLEKTREIAVLKSMGAGLPSVMKIFVIEGMVIGAVGTFFGLVLGYGTCLIIGDVGIPLDPEVYYIDNLPVRIDPSQWVMVVVMSLVLAFLATIYPATKAARLRPVDGLRGE